MKISFKHRKLNSTNWLELGLFNNSVRFALNNRKMILTGAMTALSLLLLYWSDYPVWILPGFVVSFLFLIGLEVTGKMLQNRLSRAERSRYTECTAFCNRKKCVDTADLCDQRFVRTKTFFVAFDRLFDGL